MTIYTCTDCCFYSIYEANYKRHLRSNKHKNTVRKKGGQVTSPIDCVNIMKEKTSSSMKVEDDFVCECGIEFKHRSSLSRHKKRCLHRPSYADYKEITDLLEKKEDQLKELNSRIKNLENSIESDKIEIHKITNTTCGDRNIITNINNNNINNNISLRNFDDPDTSHLTRKNYKKALQAFMTCVPDLVKMVHFNDKKPENCSIYIPYINSSHVNIFKNGKWISTNMKPIISGIFDDHCYLIQQWVEEQGPNIEEEIKRMFVRFERELAKEKNKKKSYSILKEVLYNGRDMVKKNKYVLCDKNVQ